MAKRATTKSDVIIKLVRMQIVKTIFSEDFARIRFMKPAKMIAIPAPINQSAYSSKASRHEVK